MISALYMKGFMSAGRLRESGPRQLGQLAAGVLPARTRAVIDARLAIGGELSDTASNASQTLISRRGVLDAAVTAGKVGLVAGTVLYLGVSLEDCGFNPPGTTNEVPNNFPPFSTPSVPVWSIRSDAKTEASYFIAYQYSQGAYGIKTDANERSLPVIPWRLKVANFHTDTSGNSSYINSGTTITVFESLQQAQQEQTTTITLGLHSIEDALEQRRQNNNTGIVSVSLIVLPATKDSAISPHDQNSYGSFWVTGASWNST